MDPLTHTLFGAVVFDALPFTEKWGRRGLFFAMTVSALPDVDFLPAFVAALPGNLIPGRRLFAPDWTWLHRSYTHSLTYIALFCLAVFAAGRFLTKAKQPGQWAFIAFLCLACHILLDLLNGGVALLLPFSARWIRLGDLPVVEPVVITVSLVCLLGNHSPATFGLAQSRSFGTLERAWGWLHAKVGGIWSRECRGRVCLAAIAVWLSLRVALDAGLSR